jgi:hypothetical protein
MAILIDFLDVSLWLIVRQIEHMLFIEIIVIVVREVMAMMGICIYLLNEQTLVWKRCGVKAVDFQNSRENERPKGTPFGRDFSSVIYRRNFRKLQTKIGNFCDALSAGFEN